MYIHIHIPVHTHIWHMIHSGIHEELICELYPFMTSTKEIENRQIKKHLSQDNKYFFSKQNDNLMYCIYSVIKNTLDINDFNTDFNKISPILKQTAIEKCKSENGSRLKAIRQTKNEFMNSVFSMKTLDWEHFSGMCLYHDMVIILTKNKIAFIYGDIDIHPIKGYITINENDNYTCFEKQANINLDEFYVISNPLKPIRPISNYKLDDLKKICNNLNIDCESMKKTEMYAAICKEIAGA